MSAGIELPRRVFGHGFLNIEGQKMSKSLGNVITPKSMVDEFGLDQVRYFLMREVPYGNDGSFSKESMVNRINSDLANDFGNLAQRVLSFIAKNLGGTLPVPGALTADDKALIDAAKAALPDMREAMKTQQIHRMLEAVWKVVGDANRYIDAQAPWALKKTDPARMGTVLYVAADVIRILAIYAQSITPGAAGKLLAQLGVPEGKRNFADIETPIVGGAILPAPSGVFPRYVEAEGAA
jgi:methionyl-tRNA synthetase